MSTLMPRDDQSLSLDRSGPLDAKRPKQLVRAVNRQIARGIEGAARAQAAGYVANAQLEATELVTEQAMLGLHRLHQVKQALGPADPVEADDYNSLIRDYTLIARTTIRNLPREW